MAIFVTLRITHFYYFEKRKKWQKNKNLFNHQILRIKNNSYKFLLSFMIHIAYFYVDLTYLIHSKCYLNFELKHLRQLVFGVINVIIRLWMSYVHWWKRADGADNVLMLRIIFLFFCILRFVWMSGIAFNGNSDLISMNIRKSEPSKSW